MFLSTSVEHQEAIGKSGYKSSLKYKFNNTPKQNRNRCRNITRWNPRFDKVATTGIEKRFLRLLEKQVAKSRNTIKVNISGMETAS